MCDKFFFWLSAKFSDIADEFKRGEEQRRRNVINATNEDFDGNERRKVFIRQKYLTERVFYPNELYNRLIKVKFNIWYLNILTKGDYTKLEMARKTNIIDALNAVQDFIKSIPTK